MAVDIFGQVLGRGIFNSEPAAHEECNGLGLELPHRLGEPTAVRPPVAVWSPKVTAVQMREFVHQRRVLRL